MDLFHIFFQGNSKPHVIVFGISGGTPHNIFTQRDFETDSYGASWLRLTSSLSSLSPTTLANNEATDTTFFFWGGGGDWCRNSINLSVHFRENHGNSHLLGVDCSAQLNDRIQRNLAQLYDRNLLIWFDPKANDLDSHVPMSHFFMNKNQLYRIAWRLIIPSQR